MTTATATAAPTIHYTGRVNALGDELCVVQAFSDWGERGYMVCTEVRAPGRAPFRTPHTFFAGTTDAVREEAINDARSDYFYGYSDVA